MGRPSLSKRLYANFAPVINPHALLAELPDPALFEQFRAGAELHLWRMTCPHNWWLEDQRRAGADKLVYHWPSGGRPPRAFFAFAHPSEKSAEKVSYRGWMRGHDEGLARHEVWRFDEASLSNAIEKWTLAEECARTFNQHAHSRAPDPRSLNDHQRFVLHTLKRGHAWPLHPRIELGQSVGYADPDEVDLCARGLAYADPIGVLRPTEQLSKLPIARKTPAAARAS